FKAVRCEPETYRFHPEALRCSSEQSEGSESLQKQAGAEILCGRWLLGITSFEVVQKSDRAGPTHTFYLEESNELESMAETDCGCFCIGDPRPRLLRQSQVVSLHRIRRREPDPVGVHGLVPHDDLPEEVGG